jgi:hypothetical protein
MQRRDGDMILGSNQDGCYVVRANIDSTPVFGVCDSHSPYIGSFEPNRPRRKNDRDR